MNAQYVYLGLVALHCTLALIVGMALGEWIARRDRRDTIARRQTLAQLFAVANTRAVRR